MERLRQKKRMAGLPPKVGVCWYSETEWARVTATAADPDVFEATYAEWLAMAEEALQELAEAGVHLEKVQVQAEALLAWCRRHERRNDSAARAAYAAEMARAGSTFYA